MTSKSAVKRRPLCPKNRPNAGSAMLLWNASGLKWLARLYALNPVLSIGAQLTDVLRAHMPGMSKAERRARAAELLTMVGINADRLGSYPHELSGGMRQRVMIPMADRKSRHRG